MYRTSESPAIPFTSEGGSPLRHATRDCVAFDLTIPGLDSCTAREMLDYAFGAGTTAFVVATNRLHDCTALYVETVSTDLDEVIGKLTAYFPHATLGRVTRIARH
jgi:hypothetical protein